LGLEKSILHRAQQIAFIEAKTTRAHKGCDQRMSQNFFYQQLNGRRSAFG